MVRTTSTRTTSKARSPRCSVCPTICADRVYYQPTNEGVEKRIRERLEEIKRVRLPREGKPPRLK